MSRTLPLNTQSMSGSNGSNIQSEEVKFDAPNFTDLILKTNDVQELHFWKVMLIQFEFYSKMFSSGFREGKEGTSSGSGNQERKETQIGIDCSAEVGKIILSYIYKKFRNLPIGEIIPVNLALEVYKFGEQHLMSDLKEKCKIVIVNQVPYSGDLFRFARLHKPDWLPENMLRNKYLSLYRPLPNSEHSKISSKFTKDDFDFDFWVSVGKGTTILDFWNYCLGSKNLTDDETAKTLISMFNNVSSMTPNLYTSLSMKLDETRPRWLAARVLELLSKSENVGGFSFQLGARLAIA